jgi:phosphatidylglycerophosphate synthase
MKSACRPAASSPARTASRTTRRTYRRASACRVIPPDFGGYLDIVADFVFYTAIPLGFAVRDPQAALATAFLLAGYVFTGITFLAFSAVSERRGIVDAGDNRSFIFQPGLAEGTETLIVYVLWFLAPAWSAGLAGAYCAVCAYTALSRSVLAYRLFSPQ